MTRHMALHSGQRKFSCSACGRRFKWASSLACHRCVGNRVGAGVPGGGGSGEAGGVCAMSRDVDAQEGNDRGTVAMQTKMEVGTDDVTSGSFPLYESHSAMNSS